MSLADLKAKVPNLVLPGTDIPKGSNIGVLWRYGTALPGIDTLVALGDTYGEAFELGPFGDPEYGEVVLYGVGISNFKEDTAASLVYASFVAAQGAGQWPWIMQAGADADWGFETLRGVEELKQEAGEFAEDVVEAAKDAAKGVDVLANLPRYLLMGGLVLGGLLVAGAGIWYVVKRK